MDVLFVSANSADEYIDIEREFRTLKKLFESGDHSLQILPAAEVDDLRGALEKNSVEKSFDVLHFSGHASAQEGLHLRGAGCEKEALSGEMLREFLTDSAVELVVLNTCDSEALAVSLGDVVPSAIGTTRVVRDVVARKFTHDFYNALKVSVTVKEAFEAVLEKGKPGCVPAYMYAGSAD
ncbi:MAG: CHAT domain-containing protein [Gammaproteobacteria bacterium]|nr:CHAT domain-containing protein [Gammaproteobacteria bacterium]